MIWPRDPGLTLLLTRAAHRGVMRLKLRRTHQCGIFLGQVQGSLYVNGILTNLGVSTTSRDLPTSTSEGQGNPREVATLKQEDYLAFDANVSPLYRSPLRTVRASPSLLPL